MKKVMTFVVMGLFLSASALAEVMVLQEGKTMSFKDKSHIVVSGKTATKILYNGVPLIIPANLEVSVQHKDRKVLITGTDLKNVEVADKEISSKGHTVISVDPKTKEITVLEGDVKIKNVGNRSKSKEVGDFADMSEYVDEIAAQQAGQDVERQLSNSSPSGI